MIDRIMSHTARPEPFTPSDAPFWDDPHLSTQLLAAHLDEHVEAASRPPAVLRAAVDRLVREGWVERGSRVLDLGCGPGLVAELLAEAGCVVTGVDLSVRSVAHARRRAAERGLAITYRVQDFLTLAGSEQFDVALQSYGELATFSDDVRDRLLARVRAALVPGGVLVADVSTAGTRVRGAEPHGWSVHDAGFWRPGPHLLLTDHHTYDDGVWCNQYVVVEEESVTTYRMWFHDYTPATLTSALEEAGFTVERLWEGLDGGAYAGGDWIGVVARRP